MTKVLVIGASGMLGFALHRGLHDQGYSVQGAIRRAAMPTSGWTRDLQYQFNVEASDIDAVRRAVEQSEASVVINAAGVIKQVDAVKDEASLFRLNSVFPKRLEIAGEQDGFRVIHFSTDCVFSGRTGGYREIDLPDADDAYGVSKLLGEITRSALTLRTSIIGLGMGPNGSLVDWFLSQTGAVRGFPNAFFSGLPVDAIADFVGRELLPQLSTMKGLYHLAAQRIDKATLLTLVAERWGRGDISIVPDESFCIDRSLDASALNAALAHRLADWPILIENMHNFYAPFSARVIERG
jgi:dTDP-4-dehydrorhamnose reductase